MWGWVDGDEDWQTIHNIVGQKYSNWSQDFSDPSQTVLRILAIEVPFMLSVDGDHTFEGPVP